MKTKDLEKAIRDVDAAISIHEGTVRELEKALFQFRNMPGEKEMREMRRTTLDLMDKLRKRRDELATKLPAA